ncbi:MAG TPA: aminotransferase class V-fold PLP-dependent enzyme [Burkholderiales bacterium]|nr:aminotransferase class V-fold PLP-dependent enzyme [Burkholderiales bacterium]
MTIPLHKPIFPGNQPDLDNCLARAAAAVQEWRARWPAIAPHPAQQIDLASFEREWHEYVARLQTNPPFFHPGYAAQMIRPPHPVAVLGYLAAMLVNPNNYDHAGGPATAEMEHEAIAMIAAMLHLPRNAAGHLAGGGTIANLEALWVARELGPRGAVAVSDHAHFAHFRNCALLGVECVKVATDDAGRIDVDQLEQILRTQRIGTVVTTAGTTALGAVDPIDELIALRERYGFRLHADACYGGFFAALAWCGDTRVPAAPLKALAQCDSVTIDPHKHGLQPLGCSAVLWRQAPPPSLYGKAPGYAEFTPGEVNPGAAGLECSRAGAAAGALWLTLKCLPLDAEHGFAGILSATLAAARRWAELIRDSDDFALHAVPDLDILTFLPRAVRTISQLDRACHALIARLREQTPPLHLGLLEVDAARIAVSCPGIAADVPRGHILRAVLMKPEHEAAIDALHAQLVAAWRQMIS